MSKYEFNQQSATLRLREPINEGRVMFTIDDEAIDQLFNKQFEADVDYIHDGPDVYYVTDQNDFEKFVDYAKSMGHDADNIHIQQYMNEEGSVTGGEAYLPAMNMPAKKQNPFKESGYTQNKNFRPGHTKDQGGFQYKDLWGMNEAYDESEIKSNANELARVEELLAQAHKDKTYSVMTAYENRIAILRFIVFLEKKLGKQLPLLPFGRNFGEYLKKELGYAGPIKQNKLGAIVNFKTIAGNILNTTESLSEENLEEAYVPENIKKFAQRKGVTNIVNQVSRWAEKAGMRIVGGTAIGKNYDTLILDLTYQGGEVRINCQTEEIKVNGEPIDDYTSFVSAVEENETINEIFSKEDYQKVITLLDKFKYTNTKLYNKILDMMTDVYPHSYEEIEAQLSLNENYARFRNETKTRSGSDQFHQAVKEVKKKVQEIGKLHNYLERMQQELSETQEGLKKKKYTELAIAKIKAEVKELNRKIRKLK